MDSLPFKTVFDENMAPVIVLGDDGRCANANEAAAAALGVPLQELVGSRLARAGANGASADGGRIRDSLSKRERQILTLVSQGQTGDQIAAELQISPETVQKHVHNAKRKLGAATRAHAIVLAMRHGQLDEQG